MADPDTTPLALIVEAHDAIRATRSRLEKYDRLAALLRRLRREEVRPAVTWLAGDLPQGRIGVGPALLRTLAAPAAPEPGLDVLAVDRAFEAVAGIAGAGSKARRQAALEALLARATPAEQRFLILLLAGGLRQGALEGIMVEAVARAADLPAAAVRRALMVSGALADVAVAGLLDGRAGLDAFQVELFRPLRPMLASPSEDAEAAIEALGEAAFELKLDGARVQVHKDGGTVRVYTRRLHEVTRAVPEVVEVVGRMPARRLILDGEAIALRPDGRPQPFQTTMRRFGRRRGTEALRSTLPLSCFFFDALLVDDDTLLDASLAARMRALAAVADQAVRVPRIVTADPVEADAFVTDALSRGHEGAMAKALDAPYAAGSRGRAWLKLKAAHTLDLVVVAVEWGSGRREGWLSNLHLAARDPATGGFVMLGKTFKGMTDATLQWQTDRFLAREIGREGHVVHVRPDTVAEVAFNDVQVSPQYPGGMALRFARLKGYRGDKAAADAATVEEVRALLPEGE